MAMCFTYMTWNDSKTRSTTQPIGSEPSTDFFPGKPQENDLARALYTFIRGIFLVGGLVAINFIFPDLGNILGMSSSQLTKSYFSEGWPNHQPVSHGNFP